MNMLIKTKLYFSKRVFFSFILFVFVNKLFAQNIDLITITDSLNNCFTKIISEKNDENKLILNNRVLEYMRFFLSKEESFKYPVNSVKNIGFIQSGDDKLKIYTWNIPLNDGTHKYFGFIQYYSKKKKQNLVFELMDKSNEIKNPEFAVLNNTNWYGALYYRVIQTKYKNKIYYTLLASDLNNFLTKKKIIDVLYFDQNEKPVFGEQIFEQSNKLFTRVIFEFNVRASMTLTYDLNVKMIVYDHLSPSKSFLKGQYEFYGPDFSYDGLKFKKGKWIEYTDIEIKGDI